jgi:prepilin-type N-terminal cleavage/methylation domain-containing protein
MDARWRAAFTLVELLVVVAIILILMGVSMKVMSVVNRAAYASGTIERLEKTKMAIEGFYALKGIYPPCELVPSKWPVPDPGRDLETVLTGENAGKTNLGYYLTAPEMGAIAWSHHLVDVAEYVDDKGLARPTQPEDITNVVSGLPPWIGKASYYSVSIVDKWGRTLIYSANPPYQSYRLWSKGQNGNDENGRGDDIEVTLRE